DRDTRRGAELVEQSSMLGPVREAVAFGRFGEDLRAAVAQDAAEGMRAVRRKSPPHLPQALELRRIAVRRREGVEAAPFRIPDVDDAQVAKSGNGQPRHRFDGALEVERSRENAAHLEEETEPPVGKLIGRPANPGSERRTSSLVLVVDGIHGGIRTYITRKPAHR